MPAPLATVALSAPSAPADLQSYLDGALATRPPAHRLIRLGFALAKTSGVDALLAAVRNRTAWDGTEKRWLIGTQFALTEPQALTQLYELGSSDARLHGFRPAARASRRLFRVGTFHGKVIASGDVASDKINSMFVGSMNLTGAALGSVPMNYEAAVVVRRRAVTKGLENEFNRWWARAWGESVPLSPALIEAYAEERDLVLAANPDLDRFVTDAARQGADFGSNLWIAAGKMSGEARNQIEFGHDLAQFFGPLQRDNRTVRVRHGASLWADRPLSHKVTTYGVDIWRLGLPTARMGGPDYQDRVICLTRSSDEEGLIFDFDVADLDSRKARRWRRASDDKGHSSVTAGQLGREYGLW